MSDYQFGVEEEFFLASAVTRGTPGRRSVENFHRDVERRLKPVERELLQCQVEIASKPSTDISEVRRELAALRLSLSKAAAAHNLLLFAAGTHPLAKWRSQHQTDKARYNTIMDELQLLGRRDVVCGMHVHVEIPKGLDRVDLMNRLMPFTPALLALSASSPFWQGRPTGLKAYRLSVFGEIPRTGIPNLFEDTAEYDCFVATMVRAGAIADGSFLWWTLRPSIHFPTLELRIADSCTTLEDTLSIAAVYRCLVRAAVRMPALNKDLSGAARAIASENLWRAQRDGAASQFIDWTAKTAGPFSDYLEMILSLIAEDAEFLDCKSEVERARKIINNKTSADRQQHTFDQAYARVGNNMDALKAVVDWLAHETAHCK